MKFSRALWLITRPAWLFAG